MATAELLREESTTFSAPAPIALRDNFESPTAPTTERAGDSLVLGVSLMLALTVVQRGVGFVRNLLFCRYLDEAELGLWSLAFSFLVLAAPLAVLGLPGSFGRYVETYRQRGQLKAFLRRTAAASGILALVATLLVAAAPRWLSQLAFNDAGQTMLLTATGLSLLAVIAFNFLTELLTALRMFRVGSALQFVQAMLFAAFGLAAIAVWENGAAAVTTAFGAASLAAVLCVSPWLSRSWRETPTDAAPLAHAEMWRKLMPFAAWVWTINLLANLFEVADRALLVHFAGVGPEAAQGLVGQYHSSRVAPLLLVSLAGMFSGVLLPYLSRDWEAGRKSEVSRRVNLAVKLVAISFSLAGAGVLLAAPLLFDWLLDGRYDAGKAILPWALVGCIWFSLATVAQDYLWCAEKAQLGAAAFLGGLVANVALGYALTTRYGLPGAVGASVVANLLLLAIVLVLCRRSGMAVDRRLGLTCTLPAAIGLGLWPALSILAVFAIVAWRGESIFPHEEKLRLAEWSAAALKKLKKLSNLRSRDRE